MFEPAFRNLDDLLRKEADVCWQFGVPPKGNANFAWVQHFIHHLAPVRRAGAASAASFLIRATPVARWLPPSPCAA